MSIGTAHSNELGAFLKARRAELTPRDVGLPEGGTHRRVPGLRGEEVAQLAAISTDSYTRLEQGRISASAPVLASLARVLRLDEDQRTYLDELAGKNLARPRRRVSQKVRPHLQRVLDHLTDIPAMVLGRNMDVLAWNPLAAALITDFSQIPEITLDWDTLTSTTDPDQQLIVWTAEAGTPSHQALRILASWAANHARAHAHLGRELGVPDPDPVLAIAEHLVRHDQRAHGAHEGERRKRGDRD